MRRIFKIIRNLLLLAIAAIVVLAGVLAVQYVHCTARGRSQVAAVPRVAGRRAGRRAAAGRGDPLPDHFELSSIPNRPPRRCAACGRISQKSFPAFHAAAKREIVGGYSLLYTWQGTDPKAAPIALLAHQDVVPVAPGTEKDWQHRRSTASSPTASSGAAARGTTRATSMRCWRPPRQMAKQGFRPKRTIYFAFGHDEEVAGTAGAKAIAGAAGLARRQARLRARRRPADHRRHHEGPRQAGGADRRRREGLCDAGADRAGNARPFLDAAARDRDRHDERGAGAAGRPSRCRCRFAAPSRKCSTRWRPK